MPCPGIVRAGRKETMKMLSIRIHLWHNEKTEYGIATHETKQFIKFGTATDIHKYLRGIADNADTVKINSTVSAICVNTDDRHIFQVCGYSASRGMYSTVL